MYQWALSKRQQGVILFAGHTHRPVFRGQSLVDRLTRELEALEQKPDTPALRRKRRALEVELEWVRASEFQTPKAIPMEAPCYFNTGCCSFADGDVTGLEIAHGQIQLVRWPNNHGEPRPEVLNQERADLRQCFEELRGPSRVSEPEAPEPGHMPPPGMEAPGWSPLMPSDSAAPH